MTSVLKMWAGLILGGLAGGYAGKKVMPGPIVEIDIPLVVKGGGKQLTDFYKLIRNPGMMIGATIGAVAGVLVVRSLNSKASSLAQAQPVNSGTVQVAITWSNGITETVASDDIVPGQDLMGYLTDGVLDIAEQQFGQNAAQMFPATLDVIHADEFYTGKMLIDQEGFPELMLQNASVKRPAFLAKGADRRNAKRQAAAQAAINEVNAGRLRVQPGQQPDDFTMPIPTHRG